MQGCYCYRRPSGPRATHLVPGCGTHGFHTRGSHHDYRRTLPLLSRKPCLPALLPESTFPPGVRICFCVVAFVFKVPSCPVLSCHRRFVLPFYKTMNPPVQYLRPPFPDGFRDSFFSSIVRTTPADRHFRLSPGHISSSTPRDHITFQKLFNPLLCLSYNPP